MKIRYDQSLPVLVEILSSHLNAEVLESSVIVRDGSGALSVVLGCDVDDKVFSTLSDEILQRLGGYARQDRAVVAGNDFGAGRLLDEAKAISFSTFGDVRLKVIDRRIVGAEWLRTPNLEQTAIPKLVFGSLKGGVGRSTALSVVAAHLSKRGRRVLAIDFDLEAPGIGTMLLKPDELPPYGTLDYFVEFGISGADDELMSRISSDSYLGSEGARVTVIPAIGTETLRNPENAIGKISRAYLDAIDAEGNATGISRKLQTLVNKFEATNAYDIILIDSRAGLHETTPAALFGVGAEILLFGTDQPQTYLGYNLLLSHMKRFFHNENADWRASLHFVHAKSDANPTSQIIADERFSSLYDVSERQENQHSVPQTRLTADDFDVEWAASEDQIDEIIFSPPPILRVLDDSNYREFDPISNGHLLTTQVFSLTFESLLEFVDDLVE